MYFNIDLILNKKTVKVKTKSLTKVPVIELVQYIKEYFDS